MSPPSSELPGHRLGRRDGKDGVNVEGSCEPVTLSHEKVRSVDLIVNWGMDCVREFVFIAVIVTIAVKINLVRQLIW